MIKAAAYNCEPLQNPIIFDEVYSMISPQRREHVDEAKTLKGKCERLGAAHLLEKLLWENHIERPYVYSSTSQGKPIFIQPKNVDFSISHSLNIKFIFIKLSKNLIFILNSSFLFLFVFNLYCL